MLSSIGLVIVIVTFIAFMIAPSLAFVPGLGEGATFLATHAWWILPLGLFLTIFSISRNIILTLPITAVAVLLLMMGGIIVLP